MSIYIRRETPGRLTIKAGTEPRGWKAVGDGWVVAKTWEASANDSGGPFVATLSRLSGTSTPSSLLYVEEGFFAGLYVSTAEVEEQLDPAPPLDCDEAVEAAIVADRALAHVEWS